MIGMEIEKIDMGRCNGLGNRWRKIVRGGRGVGFKYKR